MENLESKIGEIMGNPEMMQKIMSIAQSMNAPEPQESAPEPPKQDLGMSLPDMAMLQKLTSFAGKSTIDAKQRKLLDALGPYLSSQRVQKLEKAMRAAKMASMASGLFGLLQSDPGR